MLIMRHATGEENIRSFREPDRALGVKKDGGLIGYCLMPILWADQFDYLREAQVESGDGYIRPMPDNISLPHPQSPAPAI